MTDKLGIKVEVQDEIGHYCTTSLMEGHNTLGTTRCLSEFQSIKDLIWALPSSMEMVSRELKLIEQLCERSVTSGESTGWPHYDDLEEGEAFASNL